MIITLDSPERDDVRDLMEEHLHDMHATSPAESVHALDSSALKDRAVTFVSAREDDLHESLLGVGAIVGPRAKFGQTVASELKSMRTMTTARGRGVASAILDHLMKVAKYRGHSGINLETGSHEYFAPARRLYSKHGFTECGPYGEYREDPNSVYMNKGIQPVFL